jgi:chemotaxis protein methyltransferase CheR
VKPKDTVGSEDVARFRALVRARTGMVVPGSRTADLERALERAVAAADLPDARALHGVLSRKAHAGDLLDAMVSALNVGETHFFRGAPQIKVLEQRILPKLIDRRGRERRLRIWSAGCSTGEEAYTLAILLRRLLPAPAEWDVLILATDINGRSLERARRGLYTAWSLRGAPEFVRNSYLAGEGNRFEIAPQIRDMVTFSRLNLAEDDYPSVSTNTQAMDLIVCRNVLLYFDEDGTRAVMRRLRDALAEGGWLMLGPVEAGLGAFDGLEQDEPGTAAYRRSTGSSARSDREESLVPSLAQQTATRQLRRKRPRSRPWPPSPPSSSSPPSPPSEPGILDGSAAFEVALELWRTGRAAEALGRLEAEAEGHPLIAPLHYLTGLILLEEERTEEAIAAFRRSTYADPSFALGHLAQGIIFAGRGSRRRAAIGLENAARLVTDLEPDAVLPYADGLTASDVLALVAVQRELLEADALEVTRA